MPMLPTALRREWEVATAAMTRPYRVTAPMVILVFLVPVYLFLPDLSGGRFHAPALPLDARIPLQPAWAILYGCAYAFLIVLPVLAIRDPIHISRTVLAYLSAWLTAYGFFIAYPTVAPRPAAVAGDGFAPWALRLLYDSDPPYNCFPSLHVAHSFVSAFAVLRLHRKTGVGCLACATVVALSTLFTKQHYIADVIGGFALAAAAASVFLRKLPSPTADDTRAVPALSAGLAITVTGGVVLYWALYRFTA